MRALVGCSLLALVTSCAIGVPPGVSGDDDVVLPDARIDARPIDAPPATQTITLSQTPTQAVEPGSIACTVTDPNMVPLATRENSYYRVFRLSDFGVTRPFTPTMVTFGIEQATSPIGSQTAQVRLHTLNGPLTTTNLVPIATNNTVLVNSGISSINVPISPAPVVQPNATLVAEVFSPDGDPNMTGSGNVFFIGTNQQTETASGYLASASCGVFQPTAYAALGDPTFARIRLVLTVTGTY